MGRAIGKISNFTSTIWGNSVQRAWREAGLWVAAAVAFILLAALLTYSPEDAGFTDTGEVGSVLNAVGPVGAWIADFLFFCFGRAAYLFPLSFLFVAVLVRTARQKSGELKAGTWTTSVVIARGAGFLIMLLATSVLAALHFEANGLTHSAGGVVGAGLGNFSAQALSFLGATVVWLALWLASVSLFLSISWLALMDRIGFAGVVLWRRTKLLPEVVTKIKAQIEEKIKTSKSEKVAARENEHQENVLPSLRVFPQVRIEPRVGSKPSERVERERQGRLFSVPTATELPPLSLLNTPESGTQAYSDEALQAMSRQVEIKLKDFGIEVEVVAVSPGPVVTCFELRPAPGFKVSRLTALAKDLARSLSVTSVRVVEVIPGKSVIGLEIPNENREIVHLSEVLQSEAYEQAASPLTLALGKDVSGQTVVTDLAKMPHLMIAGTTGSGKSVAINAMVLSLLYKSTPEQVRLILIDPKMLELSVYEDIPHLLTPVVTDMQDAANALRWAFTEMERRYRIMSSLGVRNISGYNRKVRDAIEAGTPLPDPTQAQVEGEVAIDNGLQPFPYIVVVIDELADMMMVVGKKVEELIVRLAQKARAAGVHLILATQRPSVDVITGLIKANIPARIAFQVSARVDSRTILDQIGAESLLGHGDMLFLPAGTSIPIRIHGAFVSDEEVHQVVGHLRSLGKPTYLEDVLEGGLMEPIPGLSGESALANQGGEEDPLYDDAVRIVTESQRASISGVQRRLRIGYNRAARLVEAMESAGVVGQLQSNGSREVLAAAPPRMD